MDSIYIKQIRISGYGKADAIIDLKKGLNVIYGPSNTGKTYIVQCIDYLLGASDNPINSSHGYDCISAEIATGKGTVLISRLLGSNKLKVISSNPNIESGVYNKKGSNYNKTISYVWLKLIGIDGQRYIIKNESFNPQTFTVRTFIHMFLLLEERIIRKESILYSGITTASTAELSSLIFLSNGKSYDESTIKEKREIQIAKKDAVVNYINSEITFLAERKKNIQGIDRRKNLAVLAQNIEDVFSELETAEKEITIAINSNKKLLEDINEQNQKYSESCLLLDRYGKLETQYKADLQRLNFIVDCENNTSNHSITKCPVCDGKIVAREHVKYTEAAKIEFNQITLQLRDLAQTMHFVNAEKETSKAELEKLQNEKLKTEQLITKDLTPKVNQLKVNLEHYKKRIQEEQEEVLLDDLAAMKIADIHRLENESDDGVIKYKPKDALPSGYTTYISKQLKKLLKDCNYDNLLEAYLDLNDMDAVINGIRKRDFGKGYRAFINTIYSLSIFNYLCNEGTYSPGFAVYDSPILSLKEKGERERVSESMKEGLFRYLTEAYKEQQIIIIENEIPDINYEFCNLIQFTKDEHSGRYGLLPDVKD